MTDLAAQIKETANEIVAARERLKEQSQQLLQEGFKKIFEAYPTVGKVVWTQYTPYFNDGDPCEFGVHEWEVHESPAQGSLLDEEDEDEGYGYGESSGGFSRYRSNNKVDPILYRSPEGYESRYGKGREGYVEFENPHYDPEYGEPYQAIMGIYEAIDQDSMKEIFGDHVMVTVTKSGIDVTEYDHD